MQEGRLVTALGWSVDNREAKGRVALLEENRRRQAEGQLRTPSTSMYSPFQRRRIPPLVPSAGLWAKFRKLNPPREKARFWSTVVSLVS